MKFIFQIFLISISMNAQQERSADFYAHIPEKIENAQEIRIYKDRGIINSGSIFRIYNVNSRWKAELIQWFYQRKLVQMNLKILNQ